MTGPKFTPPPPTPPVFSWWNPTDPLNPNEAPTVTQVLPDTPIFDDVAADFPGLFDDAEAADVAPEGIDE